MKPVVEAARLEDVEELLDAEPFLAYANFAPIASRAGALRRLHGDRWRAAHAAGRVLVARSPGGAPLAALRTGSRDFESSHFALRMASLETPLARAGETERLEAMRALYSEAVTVLRGEGFQHGAAQASTLDRAAGRALQEAGFFHVGTRISWMAPLDGGRPLPALEGGLAFEILEKDAIASLAPDRWARLFEWCGRAFDHGPLVFDVDLDEARARGVYQEWTRRALLGEWADAVLVVVDGDEVVAFHTMLVLDDLSLAAGAGVLGRGIGGTLPGYRGLFTALQRATASARPLGASWLENETQSSTVASIHVFGKLGHPCVRSTSSFHRRLDLGAPRDVEPPRVADRPSS